MRILTLFLGYAILFAGVRFFGSEPIIPLTGFCLVLGWYIVREFRS